MAAVCSQTHDLPVVTPVTDAGSRLGLADSLHLRGIFVKMKGWRPGPRGIGWESAGIDNLTA